MIEKEPTVTLANAELIKDSMGFKTPLYTVDFIEDRIFDGRQNP